MNRTSSLPPAPTLLILAMALVVSPPLARAQPPAPDRAPADAIETLSPFEVKVTKDVGYEAADTVSVGEMATNLLTTPSDLTVQTRQFLDDISAATLNDAINYLPNAVLADASTNNTASLDTGANFTFRGLPTGGNSRNYFSGINTTINAYVTERLEQVRGPNSILYGTSLAGGQINVITKRAVFNDQSALGARFDTRGSRTVTADVNRQVGPLGAIRINAVDQQLRTWIKSYFDNLKAADLAATLRPWRNGEFRFDGELSFRKTATAASPEGNMADGYSGWDGKTVGGTSTGAPLPSAPATSTGVVRSGSSYFTASPVFGNTMLNLQNYGVTTGSGITLSPADRSGLVNFPALPARNFSAGQPGNAFLNNRAIFAQEFFDQSWDNGLAAEVASSFAGVKRDGQFQAWFGNVYRDIVPVLPDGTANREFGNLYSQNTIQDYGHEQQDNLSFRASLLYPWKTRWFTQTFALVANTSLNHYNRQTYTYARLNNGNPTTSTNVVTFRQYWDDPNAPVIFPTSDAAGDPFGYVLNNRFIQRTYLDSIQLGSVGTYLDNKLTLMGGLRRDVYNFGQSTAGLTNGAITSWTYKPAGAEANTGAIGATYFPIDWLGAYADASGGFNPNPPSVGFFPGQSYVPNDVAHSQSAGLRLNLFHGTIVGSIGYYEVTDKNRLTTVSATNINAILTQLQQPLVPTSFEDQYDYKAHGWEADIVANVNRHLRLTANLALPTTEEANALPGAKSYLAANFAAWTAATSLPGSVGNTIATNLLTFENTVSSAGDGRALNGTNRYRANAFGEYLFDSGILRGFRVGGGVNVYGPRLIGNYPNLPYAYIYQKAYAITNLSAGYGWKLWQVPVELQLNVSNLFNYADPIYYNVAVTSTGGQTASGIAYKNSYTYIQPLTETVSATIRF